MGPELPVTVLSTAFRIVLFCGICFLVYSFFFKLRKPLTIRLLGLFLGAVLVVFIIVPGWSDIVANQFGIGRGVDMVLYLAQLLWAYVTVRLFASQQQMMQQITELTRSLALASARPPALDFDTGGRAEQESKIDITGSP